MVLNYGDKVIWKRVRNGDQLISRARVLYQWNDKEVKIKFVHRGRLKFQSVPLSQVTLDEGESDELSRNC